MGDFFGGDKVNILELKRQYQDVLEPEGFNENDLAKVTKRLHILHFHPDRKKTDVVSEIDGKIVFVMWNYKDMVAVDDVWLCSVKENNTVYDAMPLLKITAATAMEFSDSVRAQMLDALWEKNRSAYEKTFAEQYQKKVHDRAFEESESRHKDIIDTLQRENSRLHNELDKSRYIIDSRNSDELEFEEEILLGVPPAPVLGACEEEEEIILAKPSSAAVPDEQAPPMRYINPVQSIPGLPEMRVLEGLPRSEQIPRKFNVERIGPRTLYCESFTDGKYFVHINMSKKFLVIRPNGYGHALCINHRMVLSGLDDLSSFVGPKQLMAEWDARYDGLLVYL